MSLRSILTASRPVAPHSRPPAAGRRAGFRPRLEPLDGRCLPSFSPVTTIPLGASPQSVAVADFNIDGKLDLATVGYDVIDFTGTVTVLLGDGQGGFGAQSQSFGAWYPNRASVAVGDFNADGTPDLAVGSGWAELSVLLGNGDGSFAPPVSSPLSSFGWAQSVAVGDFNADGTMDLAVAAGYDLYDYAFVEVLQGNGQGGFASSYVTYIGGYTDDTGVAVADLNADGKADVAVTRAPGNAVAVLLGNGNGTLGNQTNYKTATPPRAVTVGDFTGDGVPDLVTAGATVDVLPGNGNGTFAAPVNNFSGSTGMTAAAVADLNADGRPDLVTADPSAGTVSAFLGWGGGTLTQAAALTVGGYPFALAVGDFNGDGRPDAAASDYPSNSVSVLFNDGAWPGLTRRLEIGDAAVTEGNNGSAAAVFTVTLTAPANETVTVRYATLEESAWAGTDFQATNGILTFAPGETSKPVSVSVAGDRLGEPDEFFTVRLSDPVNAPISDGIGRGTIRDDEPQITVGDASRPEGKNGSATMSITVTLSAPYDQPVTVTYATRDGTARVSDRDYSAKSGTLTFAAGVTSMTIPVTIKGDKTKEADEYFSILLSAPSGNARIAIGSARGWIINDD
jgi:hypothetical protein